MNKEKVVEHLNKTGSLILKILNTVLIIFGILLFLYPISELILWILEHIFPIIWPKTFHFGWITDFANNWLPYIYHPKCNWFCFMMFNFVCIVISGFCAEYNCFPLCGILGVLLVYFNFNPHLFETWIGWITALGVIICIGLGADGSGSSETQTSSVHTNVVQQEKIIGYAAQRGSNVNVYDLRGRLMFFEHGKLVDYTSQFVSVCKGKTINVYDSKGRMQSWYDA